MNRTWYHWLIYTNSGSSRRRPPKSQFAHDMDDATACPLCQEVFTCEVPENKYIERMNHIVQCLYQYTISRRKTLAGEQMVLQKRIGRFKTVFNQQRKRVAISSKNDAFEIYIRMRAWLVERSK